FTFCKIPFQRFLIPTGIPPLRSGTFELSNMNQSIDDMFSNCSMEMEKQVQNLYFPREIQNDLFREAWNKNSCAQQKLDMLQSRYKALTINHTKALCVYTGETPNLYEPLNGALRTGAANYSTPYFQYHALYFWLTSAIQILKNSCETVYRRTPNVYNGQKGQIMRFGYFASTSRKPDLFDFGSETCFHIETCYGAYIDKYSVIEGEEEVLVPSYEVFQVIDMVSNSHGDLRDCKKIFVLKSVGNSSILNCKAANHNQQIRSNLKLMLVFQLLIGLLWNQSLK
uniref:NAD(P)(+)--arginine ADP-ribosyltransferase n=1 Tax=Neogobius melanostomus TaxID=47308 RepID=A0A8C6WEQ0_9GOBI